jgi:Fe2+ transport system protein FeoA
VKAAARPGAEGGAVAGATLADLGRGGRGRIARVEGLPGLVQRLSEMGLTPGAEVEVVRFAPLGDPIEVRVRGYALSLRRADARAVRLADES